MNKLTTAKRVAVVAALVEGHSDPRDGTHDERFQADNPQAAGRPGRSVRRLSRHARARLAIGAFRWMKSGRSSAKAKNVDVEKKADLVGRLLDVDRHRCRLETDRLVSRRLSAVDNAHELMKDVASRLANRVQLTTDGSTWYPMRWNAPSGSTLIRHDPEALRWRRLRERGRAL